MAENLDFVARFIGENDVRRAQQSIMNFGNVAQGANSLVRRGAEQAGSSLVGVAARYVAVAASVATAKQAFTGFASVDYQMRRMQVQTGATWEEMVKLQDQFREWAKSGKSVEEIGAAFDYLRERARLSVDDTKAVFPAVKKGASATNTELLEMSKAVGSFMLNMGLAKDKVLPVMDMLTKASRDNMFEVNQLANAVPELSATMKDWGYTGTEGIARMIAQIALLQKTFGDTGNSADALLRLYRLMGNPQIAEAAQLTPEGMIRTLKAAQARGEDVMTVFVKLIKLGESRGLLLDMLGKREKDIIKAITRDWGSYNDVINNSKDSIGEAAAATEKLALSPQKALNKLYSATVELGYEFGHLLDAMGATTGVKALTMAFGALADALGVVAKAASLLKDPQLIAPGTAKELNDSVTQLRRRSGLEERETIFGPAGSEGFHEQEQRAKAKKDEEERAQLDAFRKKLAPKTSLEDATKKFEEFRKTLDPNASIMDAIKKYNTDKPNAANEVGQRYAGANADKAKEEEARKREAYDRVRKAAEKAGSPNPDITAAIAMQETNFLAQQGAYAMSGKTNIFNQRGRGTKGFVVGPDRSQVSVFEDMEDSIRQHLRDYGSSYKLSPQDTLKTMQNRPGNRLGPATNEQIIEKYMKFRTPAATHPENRETPPPPRPKVDGPDLSYLQEMREEFSKPIKMNIQRDLGEVQFRRMSLRREAEREVREARWLSFMDVGAA